MLLQNLNLRRVCAPTAFAALLAFASCGIVSAQTGTNNGSESNKTSKTGIAVKVPGVVIDHVPASTGLYIGSPSIAILTNGDYVASHDYFGPKSAEFQSPRTAVFASADRGETWRMISTIQGQFWSTIFVHHGVLYILGTDKHHGNAIIRRSLDGGHTWTSPTNSTSGLLRNDGQYHCAPTPITEYHGRLWRGMERRDPPIGWGVNYRAGMMSVPVEADLLDAKNWTFAEFLPSNTNWNNGDFGAWLEGNAVVMSDGSMVDVLRVHTKPAHERAAIVHVNSEGTRLSFDPETGFVDFPGGAKKFTIRFDPVSKKYWALSSIIEVHPEAKWASDIRNTLALTSSPDLTNWTVCSVLLHHEDHRKHGFQYVDWLFDGEDIIAACRTAYDDEAGGAHNHHDANFLTFHRIKDFRKPATGNSTEQSRK
jgi:hypothetical protein